MEVGPISFPAAVYHKSHKSYIPPGTGEIFISLSLLLNAHRIVKSLPANLTTNKLSHRPALIQPDPDGFAFCFGGIDGFSNG